MRYSAFLDGFLCGLLIFIIVGFLLGVMYEEYVMFDHLRNCGYEPSYVGNVLHLEKIGGVQ